MHVWTRLKAESQGKTGLGIYPDAQEYVGKFLATFKEFPPSQRPGSFSIDGALQALQTSNGR